MPTHQMNIMNSLQHGHNARIDAEQCPKGPTNPKEQHSQSVKICVKTAAQTVLNWWWGFFVETSFHRTIQRAAVLQWATSQLWLTHVFEVGAGLCTTSSLPHYSYHTCQTNAAAIRPRHEEACCVEVSNNTSLQLHVPELNSFIFNGTHAT